MPTIYTAATFWSLIGIGAGACVLYILCWLFAWDMAQHAVAFLCILFLIVLGFTMVGQEIYAMSHNEGMFTANLYFVLAFPAASVVCGIPSYHLNREAERIPNFYQ